MKTTGLLVFIFAFLALGSCRNNTSEPQEEKMIAPMMSETSPPPPPPPSASDKTQGQYTPKLVKKGEVTISSKDLDVTKSLINRFVKDCDGFVTNENFVNTGGLSFLELTLNIPATRFDGFLRKLDSSGIQIVSRTISVEDISLQYVDDSTRLQNKKKLEQKYLELLSRTNDMKNILDIEEKLETIQSDIEVRESQLTLLDRKVAYSELAVRIEKSSAYISYDESNRFGHRLLQGISAGWDGFKSMLIFLFAIWPLYIVGAIILWIIIRVKRRRRQNK